MAVPTPPQGSKQLEELLKIMQQFNLLLGGVPSLIQTGLAIYTLFRSTGRSHEEAVAEVAKFLATTKDALDYNVDWLLTHPRVSEAASTHDDGAGPGSLPDNKPSRPRK